MTFPIVDEAVLYDWYNQHRLARQNLDIRFFADLAGRRGAREVLELGCGTGRVTIPLAAAGLAVTGLDRSDAMLRRAADHARGARVDGALRWVQADMAAFCLDRAFDLILVPYSAFQCLAPAARAACLASAADHLRPTGALVIDISPNFAGKRTDGPRHVLTEACPELRAVVALHSSVEQRSQAGETHYVDEYDLLFQDGRRERRVVREVWHSLPQDAWLDLFAAGGFDLVALHGGYERPAPPEPYKLIFELVAARGARARTPDARPSGRTGETDNTDRRERRPLARP